MLYQKNTTMKKIISILFLLLISLSVFSESKMDSALRVNKQQKELKTTDGGQELVNKLFTPDEQNSLSRNTDTIVSSSKTIWSILKQEVKMFGIKKTIQINANILLPMTILIILLLLWLKGRK